jgi:hypothetical protein
MKVRLMIDLELPDKYEVLNNHDSFHLTDMLNSYYVKTPTEKAWYDGEPDLFEVFKKARLSLEIRHSSGYTLEEFR